MRVSSAFVGFVGAAAGLAAGVATYQSSATVDETPEQAAIAVPAVGRPLPDPPPRIRTVAADCTPPAKLQDGVCITRVVQSVPVAAPQPASAVAPPASAPASSDGGLVGLTEEQREEAREAAEDAAEEAEDAAEEAAEEQCDRDDDDSDDDCQDDSSSEDD